VATVYDGQQLRNYVDGVQQGAFAVASSRKAKAARLSARASTRFFFKGALRLVRFTRRALAPAEFVAWKELR